MTSTRHLRKQGLLASFGNQHHLFCILILCQRFAMDAAYYTAKELLMTERTYKKDLQVMAVVSCDFFFAISILAARRSKQNL